MLNLPLYSHPCTWVFIDDHTRFLRALDASLPKHQPRMMFDKPREALDFLQQCEPVDPMRPEGKLANGELTLHFDLDRIADRLTDPARFDEVSVVVCDYAMPGINGLELLQNIEDRAIRRILLTGVADEELAVQAFNAGIIDRFVKKGAGEAMAQLIGFIEEQQRAKLGARQQELATFATEQDTIVFHPAFETTFTDLLERLGIIEYYYSTEPRGFLGLDPEGQSWFVVITHDSEFDAVAQKLRNASAEETLANDVAARRMQSLIFEPIEEPSPQTYDWGTNSVAVAPLPNCEGWFHGVTANPPLDVDFDLKRISG